MQHGIVHAHAGFLAGIDDAIESQSKIGWWALICGRWSIYWEQAQQQYLTAIRSPKSSKRWQASLITLFWNTSWDLWNFRNGVDHNPNNIINNEQKANLINQIKIQWSLGAPAEFEKIYYAGGKPSHEQVAFIATEQGHKWMVNAEIVIS